MSQEDFKKLFKYVCTKRDEEPYDENLHKILCYITELMIGMADDQEIINEIFNELGWN